LRRAADRLPGCHRTVARIQVAARKVCGLQTMGPMPLDIVSRLRVCAKDATDRAIADINAPTLLRHRQIVVQNTND